jgi:hypothetical protein
LQKQNWSSISSSDAVAVLQQHCFCIIDISNAELQQHPQQHTNSSRSVAELHQQLCSSVSVAAAALHCLQ